MFPTPTLDIRAYLDALVIVLTLSSSSLAAIVSSNFLMRPPRTAQVTHLTLMSVVALFGLTITRLPDRSMLDPSWLGLALGGMVLGAISVTCNRQIKRRVSLIGDRSAILQLARPPAVDGSLQRVAFDRALLVAIAVLEEVLFRGQLVTIVRSWSLTWFWTLSILLMTTLTFAATHVAGGVGEVLGKIPLSVACLGAVLLSAVILPAICAHVVFNLATIAPRSSRRSARSPKAPP